MTNPGFRCLMLAAVAATCALFSTSSNANADEAGRAVSDIEKASAIQIVPGVPQVSEAVKVVIAPAGQTPAAQTAEFENKAPIVVAPYEEEESDNAKPRKKRVKRSNRAKHALKKKEAAKEKSAAEKPAEKKPVAAPLAKETASEKARAEWRRKCASENAPSKAVKAATHKAVQSVAAAKKRATLANGPSTAGASASARSPKPVAMKTGHLASGATRKDSRSYREIYNSIPFRRAEYDANPAYRHQATLEIMLGQLHPIIVAPAVLPPQETRRDITVRFLPSIRPGYRPYSQYPWH